MDLALPELPEEIQRIIVVSLPPRAFARSSVLSKSWLSFYNSTRYSFSFNFNYDLRSVHEEVTQEIHEEVTQEIMNFDESFSASLLREKLSVEEFNININHHIFDFSASLLREKLSVEEFNININHHIFDVNIPHRYTHELKDLVYKWLVALFTTNNIVKVLRIQTSQAMGEFYMPPEIFSNESLQVLHLNHNCILDRVHSINLACLRVLSVDNIDGKSTNRLLTACPILEQLTLSTNLRVQQHIVIKGLHELKDLNICGFADVRIQEAHKLKDLFINEYADVSIQEAPALENVTLITYYGDDHQTIINFPECRRIKVLSMYVNSERTATHIQQIASCLPELENLSLIMECATDITISSRCLKNLNLSIYVDQDLKMVKINAPNLRCYEYICGFAMFFRPLMMKTGMLEMVEIDLMNIKIGQPYVLELRKALRMIEELKLGVDTVKLNHGLHVCVKASRSDEKLNVSATRVIEMLDAKLDAGAVKFDVDGNFYF